MIAGPEVILEGKQFVPGTTGWTESDLDDPVFERLWISGRYEILHGVLTYMPAAYFSNTESLDNLVFLVRTHLKSIGERGSWGHECDLVIGDEVVLRPDAAYLDSAAKARQRAAAIARGKTDAKRRRLYVPPTLVIEAVSPGHERSDRETKRASYAKFGVKNYWLLDDVRSTLECLVLDGADYRLDSGGTGGDEVRPTLFPGLAILLAEVWSSE